MVRVNFFPGRGRRVLTFPRQQGTGLYFCFVDTARHLIASSGGPDSKPVVPQIVSTFVCGSLGGVVSWGVICEDSTKPLSRGSS